MEGLRQFGLSLSKSIQPFRWVGYILLVLSVLDWIMILIPPQLMNPVWELQAIGQLVERVPVLLIALVFIFFAETSLRAKWERRVVPLVSWLCLLFGILYFLFVPLGILDTIRIAKRSDAQLETQFNQQLAQANQLEQQLNAAPPETIVDLVEQQGGTVQGDPTQVKDQLLSELTAAKENLSTQLSTVQSNQRLNLAKNSVKWNLGALISAILLIYLWRSSRWARQWSK